MEIQQLEFLKHILRFKRQVYLDHNATTNVSRHVRRKMNHVLKYCYGNPSSLYGIARKSAEIMEEARQHVADAIHADAHEIYFTGCATESNNAVLRDFVAEAPSSTSIHIVVVQKSTPAYDCFRSARCGRFFYQPQR